MQQITLGWFPESERLSAGVRDFGSYLIAAVEFLKNLDRPILLALLLVPVLLAAAGRSPSSILATVAFSGLALILLTETAEISLIGSLLPAAASFLVGLFAIGQRRKQRQVDGILADLKTRLARLEAAGERRWLSKIKSAEDNEM